MVRQQKLKVYRTPIGFHDAYVAAPSQKAALKAWGADVDLFARGVAEVVTDAKLTGEALGQPGAVIRRLRGTSDEHMAALPKDRPAARRRAPPAVEDDGPAPRRQKSGRKPAAPALRPAERPREPTTSDAKEKPKRARQSGRPSRTRLDNAEEALEKAEADHKQAIADIREREMELQKRRRDLESRHEDDVARLEAAIARAREAYGAALEKWRG